jgi:hypothetical protein
MEGDEYMKYSYTAGDVTVAYEADTPEEIKTLVGTLEDIKQPPIILNQTIYNGKKENTK